MTIRSCQTSRTDPNLDSTGECVRATAPSSRARSDTGRPAERLHLAVHVNVVATPGRILRVDRSYLVRTRLPHLAARDEMVAPRESPLAATFGRGAQSLVF